MLNETRIAELKRELAVLERVRNKSLCSETTLSQLDTEKMVKTIKTEIAQLERAA